MQRINVHYPQRSAASQRLSLALLVSALLHGLVIWLGPGAPVLERANEVQTLIDIPGVSGLFAPTGRSPLLALRASLMPRADRRQPAWQQIDAPDPRYYPANELDILPMPRQPLRLPQAAPARPVTLLARIDASGRMIDAYVLESEAKPAQDAFALGVLRNTHFSAARKHGRTVRSEVMIEVSVPGH